MPPTAHRARYVLIQADVVLNDAAVHVSEDGRILRVAPWDSRRRPAARVIDWGSSVIMPGMVNAHAHLELSRMRGKQGSPASFTAWLRALIQRRSRWEKSDFAGSARDGALECIRTGTTLVGDISASGFSAGALQPLPLRKVVFEEGLSLSRAKAPEIVGGLESRLNAAPPDPLLGRGLSPHAPYTVSPELFRAFVDLAKRRGLPLAVHTAETREELEFLELGTGPLAEFLAGLGAIPGDWNPPGLPPVVYLDTLGVLRRGTLLVHCNYLDAASILRIAASESSVVYCPRSSAFFGHAGPPVRRLLDAGVRVALGTDSLASNDSLAMLDEMRFLFRSRTAVTADEIVRMATESGAAALGFDDRVGRLAGGYRADMAVLAVPESVRAAGLTSQILEGAGVCSAAIVQGDIAWSGAERV